MGGMNEKAGVKKEAQRNDLGKEETKRTGTGGQVEKVEEMHVKQAVDMIKNPYKYNKNVKKNIQLKMKKQKRNRNYAGTSGGGNASMKFKSSSGFVAKKYDNKAVRK